VSESESEQARKRRLEQKIQRQLDEALEASFPASDPVSIVTSHEEEDWGSDAPAPETPPGPAPPRPG
jgi:2-methylcitrate dehydratase PrpD